MVVLSLWGTMTAVGLGAKEQASGNPLETWPSGKSPNEMEVYWEKLGKSSINHRSSSLERSRNSQAERSWRKIAVLLTSSDIF